MNLYKSTYRAEIDGLRAFAVLSVVFFHAFPGWLKGGFIGVDVFFVISGFLITSHIFEKLDEGKFSFSDFFGRRIRRIFPALAFVMASSLAFGWFVLLADEYAQLGKHVASGAAFITNFILVDESGYFDNASETKPMLHLWSLAVEEQFYIIWPLVLWLAWKRQLHLLTITVIVALISFYINLRFVNSKPIENFFWPVGRFWELLSGSILAWFVLYKNDVIGRWVLFVDKYLVRIVHSKGVISDGSTVANLASLFGLLILLFGVIRINDGLPFPGKWALVPIVGALLIICAGSKAWFNRIFLMNPLAVWFGLISYPLYLWHWPILSFLQIIEGEMPHRDKRIAAVLLSMLAAWLTYKLVEKPIRFGFKRGRNAVVLIMAIAFVGAVGWYVNKTNGVTPYNLALRYISDAKGDWAYPKGLVKRNGFVSTSDKPPTVLLFGDSYIEAFGPRIVDMYSKGLIREVGFVTSGGCAPMPNSFRSEKSIARCTGTFSRFEDALSSNPIRTIIVGGSYTAYSKKNKKGFYIENDGSKISLATEEGQKKSKDAFYDFVKKLSDSYRVVVMSHAAGSPKFAPKNIISGSAKSRKIPLSASIKNTPFSINNELEEEMRGRTELLGIPFISQSQKVCPNNVCYPLTDDGMPKYKDHTHMRPFFVVSYMDILDEYLIKAE